MVNFIKRSTSRIDLGSLIITHNIHKRPISRSNKQSKAYKNTQIVEQLGYVTVCQQIKDDSFLEKESAQLVLYGRIEVEFFREVLVAEYLRSKGHISTIVIKTNRILRMLQRSFHFQGSNSLERSLRFFGKTTPRLCFTKVFRVRFQSKLDHTHRIYYNLLNHFNRGFTVMLHITQFRLSAAS